MLGRSAMIVLMKLWTFMTAPYESPYYGSWAHEQDSFNLIPQRGFRTTRSSCIKLNINGYFAINGYNHGNEASPRISIKDSIEVTIDDKFSATGPWSSG